MSKTQSKRSGTPSKRGRKPQPLVIEGSWEEAVKKSLQKKPAPKGSAPKKPRKPKGQS